MMKLYKARITTTRVTLSWEIIYVTAESYTEAVHKIHAKWDKRYHLIRWVEHINDPLIT